MIAVSRSSELRRATSLIEVLVACLILGLALVPVVNLLQQSRRITYQASQQVAAAAEAQTLLEALSTLGVLELPAGSVTAEGAELLSDAGAAAAAGSARWKKVSELFQSRASRLLKRSVRATLFAGDVSGQDRVLMEVSVTYDRMPGEPTTSQTVVLAALLAGRS
ncbi:MAG: hypothetical protein HY303_20505 [Candidatus Wallbacteria bacterium]|nr:hypothetical protein [Candidatus Wallbacteria bacterium]